MKFSSLPTILLTSTLLSIGLAANAAETQTEKQAIPTPAKDTSAASASAGTLTDTSDRGSFADRITLSFRFEGYGPSLTDINSYRPSPDSGVQSDPKAQVFSKNKVYLGYKLTDVWATGVGAQFYSYTERGTVAQEPYWYFRNTKLVHVDNFNWDNNIKIYGGFSKVSQDHHDQGQIRFAGDFTYKINPDWTAGLIYEDYFYITKNGGKGTYLREYDTWPHVDRRITDTISAGLILRTFLYDIRGQKMFGKADPVVISPNVTFLFLKKNFALNPYLDIPIAHPSARLTAIGLNANLKVL